MRLHWVWDRLFTIPDGRGRRISAFAPNRVHRQHSKHHGSGGLLAAFVVVLLVVASAAFVGGIGLALRASDPIAVEVGIGLAVGAIAGGSLLAAESYIIARLGGRSARRRQIRAHICPCCGYVLTGISVEEDGCTICPECAAAWRLSHPPRRYDAVGPVAALEARRGPLRGLVQRWQRFSTFEDRRGTRWPVGAPAGVLFRRLPRTARILRVISFALMLGIGFLLVPALITALVVGSAESLLAPIADWLVTLTYILSFPTVFVALCLPAFWVARRRHPRCFRECLDQALCPACGRSLVDVHADSDGSTECPDCGAAWATAEIARGS